MFLHQDMESLDLYGTVDATICCLDSLNYLSDLESLETAIGRLRFFVRPGGLFIFDVNTQAKFERLDGCAFIRENDNYFCTWNAEYEPDERICGFYYDIFKKRGNLWEREQEEHLEEIREKRKKQEEYLEELREKRREREEYLSELSGSNGVAVKAYTQAEFDYASLLSTLDAKI